MEWIYVSEDVLLSVLQRRHDVQAPGFPLKSFPCWEIFQQIFSISAEYAVAWFWFCNLSGGASRRFILSVRY